MWQAGRRISPDIFGCNETCAAHQPEVISDSNHILIAIWAFLGLLALGGIGMAVSSERRKFAAMNKQSSWLKLRLASIPIALFAAATVVLPARSIAGMEVLAAFYGLLITAGPLVYFGSHVVLGLWLAPRLSIRESMRVGITGLLMGLVPAFAVQLLHPWVYELAGAAKAGQLALADDKPTPFQMLEQRRYALPEVGEVWTERWSAPEGLQIDRVEREVDGSFVRVDSGNSYSLCRDGQDFHLFWPAASPAPHWRMYWKAPEGVVRSDWMSIPPMRQAEEFAVKWLPDGLVFPARVPRELVVFGRTWPDGRESFDNLPLQAGESYRDNCLPLEYHNADEARTRITAVGINMWRRETQQMLRAVFRRPPAEAAVDAPAGAP